MWSPLIGIYLGCFGFGFLFVLITALTGGLAGRIHLPGGHGAHIGHLGHHLSHAGHHHVHVGGHHGPVAGAKTGRIGKVGKVGHNHNTVGEGEDLPVFSPLIIASFLTFFGGLGFCARMFFGLNDVGSLLFSMPMAFALSASVFLLIGKLLFGSAASSEAKMSDILGAQAEITVAIREGGVGEVTCICKGFRYSFPARSLDGQSVARGTKVRIVKTDGSIVTVKEH